MGSTENQYSRAVKGARLKFECICFVGSNPTAGIISVSSVGRAIVLLTIGRGFKSLTENNLVSFRVKHLPLRAGEVSSTLTSDTSQLVQMVRIPSFHLGEPGSIPGLGIGSIAPRGKVLIVKWLSRQSLKLVFRVRAPVRTNFFLVYICHSRCE